MLPYAVVAAAVIVAHRRLLDVLRLGDEEAAALGVDVTRVRLIVIVAATIGTAAAVAVSGLIGFVGIIVPHAIRLLVGGSYSGLHKVKPDAGTYTTAPTPGGIFHLALDPTGDRKSVV